MNIKELNNSFFLAHYGSAYILHVADESVYITFSFVKGLTLYNIYGIIKVGIKVVEKLKNIVNHYLNSSTI